MLIENQKQRALILTDEESELIKTILALALEKGRIDIATNVVEISRAIDAAPLVEERDGGWIKINVPVKYREESE